MPFQERVALMFRAAAGISWRNRAPVSEPSLESRRLGSLTQLSDPHVMPWIEWLDAQDRWTTSELNRAALYQVISCIYRHTVDGVSEERQMQFAWRDIVKSIDDLSAEELDNWFVQEVMTQPGRIHGGFGDYEEQVALFTHRSRIMFNKIIGKLRESGNSV
jgi:hypothetical protein